MINLEPMTPDIALIFKVVRLRALQDSPTAFSSTYAKEAEISDEEWLKRSVRWSSDGSIGYIASEEGKPCGRSWARSRGLRELNLMVTSVNRSAIEFYQGVGFRMSGYTAPYPNDPAITEYEMLLALKP